MDLYQILEIKPNSSEQEIKKGYHRLVKIHHPDKNNNSEESKLKFQKIQSAYEVLINDKYRCIYQKMDVQKKSKFIDILEKVITGKLNIDELKKVINLEKSDFDYLKNNFMNFLSGVNVSELLSMVTNGIIKKKDYSNTISCSESDLEMYDETCCNYYYTLPISYHKVNKLDIRLDINIKLGDIANSNKKKIKIKRNINNNDEVSVFMFDLTKPYIVFIGAGDSINNDTGNLIIKLNLPNNLLWDEHTILIEQSISLYELIYGLNIELDLSSPEMNTKTASNMISITDWIPSRDGLLIEISNKINVYNLGIKLSLDYEDSEEKKEMLRTYFS